MLIRILAGMAVAFPLLFLHTYPWLSFLCTAFAIFFFVACTNQPYRFVIYFVTILLSFFQWLAVMYTQSLADAYMILAGLFTTKHESIAFWRSFTGTQLILTLIYFIGSVIIGFKLCHDDAPRIRSPRLYIIGFITSCVILLGAVLPLTVPPIFLPGLTIKNVINAIKATVFVPELKIFRLGTNHNPLATTIVLVIGESATKQRFSLYGYNRNTNPSLSSRNDLILYQDVFETGGYTFANVETILTGKVDLSDANPYYTLIHAAQSAGYHVVYLDNNNYGDGPFYPLVIHSDEYIGLKVSTQNSLFSQKVSLDGNLTDPLAKTLETQADKPLLVILHMAGSHALQSERYPSEFNRFKSHYDNTIVYTDHLLNQWISLLDEKRKGESSFFMYLSDHGVSAPPGCEYGEIPEEEEDFYNPNRYVYSSLAIPMILWLSPEFSDLHPEQTAILKQHVQTKLDNRTVTPTLLEAMGVTQVNSDLLTPYSLFNPDAHFEPRLDRLGRNLDKELENSSICRGGK